MGMFTETESEELRGPRRARNSATTLIAGLAVAMSTAVLSVAALAQDASGGMDPVTYHEDVQQIVNDNCVVCHREGGIAPMPLDSYELSDYGADRHHCRLG